MAVDRIAGVQYWDLDAERRRRLADDGSLGVSPNGRTRSSSDESPHVLFGPAGGRPCRHRG